jgi:hypothetical protein
LLAFLLLVKSWIELLLTRPPACCSLRTVAKRL